MLLHIIIAISFLSIIYIVDQNAFAFSNDLQQEYLDFQPYTGNRLIVFNDTSIDYCITKNDENPVFNNVAADAIKTWHDRIVEVTGNPFVWDMTIHIHPKNESICDAYINYLDTPDPSSFQIAGVAGFSHPLTSVANVTIYTDDYQSTLIKMAKKDPNFWTDMTIEKFRDIVKNGNHEQLDIDKIRRITLHEIGHSLSLNHPFTSDGNLQNATGIMGYNMTYNQIDNNEVLQIVRAYPNGFSKVSTLSSINLNEPNTKKIVHLGETTNLTIELPYQEGKLIPAGIEVYIFPEGSTSQKPESAPIKVLKTDGMNRIVNDGKYLDDIHATMTHWDTFTNVLSIQFKVVKQFENADIIIVAHDMGGFEKQWFLNDVLSVDKALFSNLLLDLETNDYIYHLMGENPNRKIEQENAFESAQNEMYVQALGDCLTEKNMKKCTDQIKPEDFVVSDNSTPIWMPITLLKS